MSAVDLLRRVSLFADLSEDELTALAAYLGRRLFAKDMILYNKGSPAQNLYIIESGAVRIFAISDRGDEITLDVYGSNECFGETALLDGNLRSTGAIAMKNTVIHALRRDDFLHCLELHPRMARRVMTLFAHRMEHVIAYAEHLAFMDVAGRVAALLLELAGRWGVEYGSAEIRLHLTQGEIASWVCASREMVNKILHEYCKQGLIAMEGHAIVLQDTNGLKRRIAR